jgi:hypothetical protein
VGRGGPSSRGRRALDLTASADSSPASQGEWPCTGVVYCINEVANQTLVRPGSGAGLMCILG